MSPSRRFLHSVAHNLSSISPSPLAEAHQLIAHILRIEPNEVLFVTEINDDAQHALDAAVQRRIAGEPLQHIIGWSHFRHVRVRVGPGVFIPRPESEPMVGWALERLVDCVETPRIVELCTGSGALSLAMDDELAKSAIWAVEKEPSAAEWARLNVTGTGIVIVEQDMADALESLNNSIDCVIANPPYIPIGVAPHLPADVRDYDPATALFAGTDGLDAIRVVAQVAARLLRPGGVVACEHDDSHEASAPEVFTRTGHFEEVRDHHDLTGRPRFVTARRL